MPNNISKALLRKKFSTIDSPVKPEWIKVKIQIDKINEIKKTLKSNKIVTELVNLFINLICSEVIAVPDDATTLDIPF